MGEVLASEFMSIGQRNEVFSFECDKRIDEENVEFMDYTYYLERRRRMEEANQSLFKVGKWWMEGTDTINGMLTNGKSVKGIINNGSSIDFTL